MSLIKDLPRFLVLLFAFQHFTLENWGVIPQLNPDAVHAHYLTGATEVSVDVAALKKFHIGDKWNIKTVTLDRDNLLFHEPHCLAGRATSVIGGKVTTDGSQPGLQMVCKIYHPEVQRAHEGTTLQIVRHIAETEDDTMLKHLPTLYFYGDVSGSSTHLVRSVINRKWKGHRTMRIVGLKKLYEITTLSGEKFLKAWLEIVTCGSKSHSTDLTR